MPTVPIVTIPPWLCLAVNLTCAFGSPHGAALQAGANMIVSGSAVIGSADPRSVIALLRTAVSEAIQKRSLDR